MVTQDEAYLSYINYISYTSHTGEFKGVMVADGLSTDCTGEHPGFEHIAPIQVPGCSPWQKTEMHAQHRCPVQGGFKDRLPAEERDVRRYTMVCWGSWERVQMSLNRPISRAGFVLDCTLDYTEKKEERVDVAKMISLLDNPYHPLHVIVGHRSSFSKRLMHHWCKTWQHWG